MSMTSDLEKMTNITNDILKKKKKKSYILYGYGYEGWFTLQIENGIKNSKNKSTNNELCFNST